MRLVEGIVVEVVDGYREVVFGVEESGIGVVSFDEAALADCASLDFLSVN